MENQNQESQEKQGKKKFFASLSRKKKTVIVVVVVLVLIGMIGRGFASGAARDYRGYSFSGNGNVALVVKDFEPVGIVFADNAVTAWDGYRTTYDALMKEASKKGADAIINVNISTTGVFKRTWSGSALAVKYIDTPPDGNVSIQQGIPSEAAFFPQGGWWGRNRY